MTTLETSQKSLESKDFEIFSIPPILIEWLVLFYTYWVKMDHSAGGNSAWDIMDIFFLFRNLLSELFKIGFVLLFQFVQYSKKNTTV